MSKLTQTVDIVAFVAICGCWGVMYNSSKYELGDLSSNPVVFFILIYSQIALRKVLIYFFTLQLWIVKQYRLILYPWLSTSLRYNETATYCGEICCFSVMNRKSVYHEWHRTKRDLYEPLQCNAKHVSKSESIFLPVISFSC